jgi:hypothetical protein
MTSCGKLVDPPCCVSLSSSILEAIAWLAASSSTDSVSESFSEVTDTDRGVAGIADSGRGERASISSGVVGNVDVTWSDIFLLAILGGDKEDSGFLLEAVAGA